MQIHKLKTAQIGVGHFGAYRRERMRETAMFDLVALTDWDEDRLNAAAREENAQAVSSYEELLNVPDLEAVVISTGAKFHAQQIVAAIERGLAVFVEKPLCASTDELKLLIQKQRETGAIVGVGHEDHRAEPLSQITRQFIENEAGQVVAFEATTAHSGGFHIKPDDWRGDPAKNPGGMLFQCGVHKIHELMYYFGPVKEVWARMRYDLHTTQTADAAFCQLTFESGLVGTLNAYHLTAYRHTFSIFGTRASLYLDKRYGEEGLRLMRQRTRLDNQFEPHDPVEISGTHDTCANLKSFYHAVREGAPLYPSLTDGARAVAVVFAAEESALRGCAVEVGQFS